MHLVWLIENIKQTSVCLHYLKHGSDYPAHEWVHNCPTSSRNSILHQILGGIGQAVTSMHVVWLIENDHVSGITIKGLSTLEHIRC